MQAASSSVSSGGVLSPSKTQMAPPGQQQQQQQQQPVSYGAQMQYYYAAPMPAGAQPMPTFMPQNGNGQQYATQSYCQDENGQYVPIAPQQMMMPGQQYVYMAPPQQGSGQPVMQSGQPSYVYYPQHMGQMAPPPQMYYSTMPPPPANGSQMHSEQMQPSQPQQQRVGGAPRSAPLTSSTPLPTSLEYETVQRETARNNRNIQFRYHRVLEHDELPIDELSEIAKDIHNDDTASGDKENHVMDKMQRRGGYQQQDVDQPANYKTRLCMMHASGAKCDMGYRCKFAHGLKELRSADIVPMRYPNNKYKTKLCKNFARGGTGFCPYGLRCEFVHPTDKEFQSIPPYQRMMVEEQDHTPEDYVVARHQPRFVRSGGRGATTPTKTILKNRNVAGSMMCLSQAGRDGGGDFQKPNESHENLPPHLRRHRSTNKVHAPVPKRRTSLSTKWTSEENIGHHGFY